MLQLLHSWITPRSCSYSKNEAASGSREQHKPSQAGNTTKAAAHKGGLNMQSKRNCHSPQSSCSCTEFTRHFDTLWPPQECSQRPTLPIFNSISQEGTQGIYLCQSSPSMSPSSSLFCCSGFHLWKEPPSGKRAFSRAPWVTSGAATAPKLRWHREVQPPIYSTHQFRLSAITISSMAANMPASTWHVPSCPWHTALCHTRPPWFHSLYFSAHPSRDLGVPVQPRAAGVPAPTWHWTNRQSYPIQHQLCQSHHDKLR